MTKSLSLAAILFVLLLQGGASASEPARVLVLPFAIHAQEELSYLKTQIPEFIKKHLKQEGARILDPDAALIQSTSSMAPADLRRFGISSGADFVVWGSMTRIGQQFSLDVKLFESFSESPPFVVFKEGENIEALPSMVKNLSKSLSVKIFRQKRVVAILVKGNRRIEVDAIERIIKTTPGDVYSAGDLSRDLKSVYAMGYFDDVRIEAEEGPDGKTVIFRVQEKPTLRVIRFKGNRVFDDEKITENLSIRTGSILNVFQLKKNVKRIETLYKEKNYHNVQVSYTIHPLENEQADLEFIIDEGNKIWIKQIAFEGNSAYPDKTLKKLMKTAEKGFFSWITSSGDLSSEDLEQDVERLAAFYNNNGYIKAKIGEPQVSYQSDGIHIAIKVDEGPRFKVGNVDLVGDIILSKEELREKLTITEEEYYNREKVRNDVLRLVDLYSDQGYAYADIVPRVDKDADNLVVNITYAIEKGKEVYFERIAIAGNTKTRDRVIRRELNLYEQGLFSGVQLKEGIRKLQRLDYFEDVKVNTQRGSSDDLMILKIDVIEKPTGAFSFGGGYSNDENLFGMASIAQRNLFGRGQTLELRAQLGGTNDRFTLSFVEPWFFGIPLSFGIDLFNWQTDYDDYDKDANGGRLKLSYPVYNYTRASLRYTYSIDDISNIESGASHTIRELEGENTTSAVEVGLKYDSRDKIFNPTMGSNHGVTFEYAGLGGDISFLKYVVQSGWNVPLFWKTLGFVHAKGGYVEKGSDGILPDYEKFYLGGMNSMRGFEWQGINVKDEDGAEIGGEKFVQFNFEFQVPLFQKAGVVGVLFYDTGNVYAENDDIDLGNLRESVGVEVRWYSPMGPIRIANGYILNPGPGEDDNGRWEFSMGAAF